MGKIAFLFAGQGSQYTGMGKELYETSTAAKAVFDRLEQIRPGTMEQCFTADKETLTQTINTQPCMLAVELATAAALEEKSICAEAAAGFSLGEVAALTYAKAFASYEQGFQAVTLRGRLMQQAAEKQAGSMAAVLKLEDAVVEEIAAGCQDVWPVNYNCDGQLVAAGKSEAMPAFCEKVNQAGGRAKMLAVGGGFHSPLMETAAAEFADYLQDCGLQQPVIPVYANLTAAPYAGELAATLAAQMKNPVLWKQTVRCLAKDGFDTFIEVGPGKTLCGLVKRILPDAKLFAVQDAASLADCAAALL